ncbi:MAG TPA: PAS domain S-box protein [Trichocoleus sp.]
MKRNLWIDTLQWYVGIYLAVRGALMLMLPHTLSTHVFVAIHPILPWLGIWQVLAGAALMTAVTLLPYRPVVILAHGLAASALLQAAGGHLLANTWTALVDFAILGVGTAIAPFLPGYWRWPAKRNVDLFALLMGLRMVLDGVIVLLPFNAQFQARLYDSVRPYLLGYGLAYLITGALLLLVYLTPKAPRWLFKVAHLAAGGMLWSWTIGLGLPTWNSVLFYGGLGTLLGLLPWLGSAIHRLDARALQTQLAVILVGIVALPLLFAVTLVTQPQEQTVINQALALQQTLAVTLSQDLSTYIGLHRAAVQALAKQPSLAALSPAEQQTLLRQINQEYPDIIVLTTFDAAGNAIARSDNRPLSPSVAELNSYKAARLLGEPTLNIRIGRVLQRPIVTFTAPFYDSNQQFAGMIAGAIETSQVTEHLVSNQGGTGIQTYLVDEQGRVIAHPDAGLVEVFTDYSSVPPVAALLAPDAVPGSLRYWHESAWQLSGYAQVPTLGWGVVVERPADDALAALNYGRNRNFQVLLVVAAIALVIGLLLARRLTRPLLALAYASDRLAAGDAQAPLPHSNITEVAHLATAFRAMRDRLIARTAERDQTALELQQSEAKMRRLVESNVIGVMLADMSGTILEANDAFLKMVGYSRDDLQANRVCWREMTPPEFAEVSQRSVEELKTQGVCTPFEQEYIRKDGSRVPVLLGSALVKESQNQVIGFVLDLSDRKQFENALRESEERLRLALDAGHMGAWEWNLETNVQRWDVNQYKLFGMDKDKTELKADTFFQFIHPDDLPPAQVLTERVLAQGGGFSTEFRIILPDGSVRWLSSQGMVVHGSHQRPIRLIGVNFDITARKQAEAEREQILLREQVARQEAESANRIKDEFLAVLSHELRSPLNPILGWIKLLRLGKLDATKTSQALEIIERNAQLQTQLIEDLLDVSRILQGKLGLSMVPVDLATVVDAALETVRLAAEAKSIELRQPQRCDRTAAGAESAETATSASTAAAGPLMVLGDSARLQQVVWNLLSNAVKFTEADGWVEVRLDRCESTLGEPSSAIAGAPSRRNGSTQTQEPTGSAAAEPLPQHSPRSFALITVTDTGKGIHSDFLPHVFEYFRQADSTTTRKFGGLGLGLAIVRHLVELHGGAVEAASPGEGQGATFTVRLPLIQADTSPSQEDRDALPSSLLAAPLVGLKVLVVDDERDARDLTAFVLEAAGALVTTAPSAAAALDIFPRLQPNLLISDIGMPDFDGYSLIHQIRALPPDRGGQVPAIALTAYAGELNQQRAIAAGFQHHLAKPIETQELISTIVSLMDLDCAQ